VELDGRYLLTNDWGHHLFLKPAQFRRWLAGKITPADPAYPRLQAGGFIRDNMDFETLSQDWKRRHGFLWQGPSLHILVLTERCNHKCLYCQSAAVGAKARGADMDLRTAKASVDMAFRSPSPTLTLEFQGGEPLMNWPVLRATVEYARKRNLKEKKDLRIGLVSNFSLMDDEKVRFFEDNAVSLCTSLDGPAEVHNKNRFYSGGNSHAQTVRWIKEISRRAERHSAQDQRAFRVNALLTVTRLSLSHPKEIVDEYARLKLESVFLRPLSPLGYARRAWDRVGYTSAEFAAFYAGALDRILEVNRRGTPLVEKTAAILLHKIIGGTDPGYLDLRSPCGASVGQLAYNYDGDVYTCDEGRMISYDGDTFFRVGNVFRDGYDDLVGSGATKACCASSNLEQQPACFRCAFRPWCGVCPAYNYQAQGGLWGSMPSNDRCGMMKGLFASVFRRLERPADAKVFRSWLKTAEEADA
jgi:His-Xaa-Ser system radical SAM maturase HxsB